MRRASSKTYTIVFVRVTVLCERYAAVGVGCCWDGWRAWRMRSKDQVRSQAQRGVLLALPCSSSSSSLCSLQLPAPQHSYQYTLSSPPTTSRRTSKRAFEPSICDRVSLTCLPPQSHQPPWYTLLALQGHITLE